MKWDKSMECRTYGFDLTPLLWLAYTTGDGRWLTTLSKRLDLDKELFPDFYNRNKPRLEKER